MTQISVRLEGADTVRRGLNNFSKTLAPLTKKIIKVAMERARKKIIRYPPERPGQTYVRTGTYGRSYALNESGLTYTLVSDAVSPTGTRYTRYVGGMADGSGRAWMHVGRWKLAREAVDEEIDPLVAEINAEIKREAREQGIGP